MDEKKFYSHVNYSVTKIVFPRFRPCEVFYSHVNYSVTKICFPSNAAGWIVLQSRKLFSY